MDLTVQAPVKCCSSQHLTLLSSPDTPTNRAPRLLWPRRCLLSGAACSSFPLFPRSISHTFRHGGLVFWCHTFLSFYTGHEGLTAHIPGWFAFPPPVDHGLLELSAVTMHLGWPYVEWLIASMNHASPFDTRRQ